MAISVNFDYAVFIAQYEEFKDQTKYPEALIEAYWDMANEFVSVSDSPFAAITGKTWVVVLNMLTAHLMKLGKQASQAAANGAQGGAAGFVTSASVGEVSVAVLSPPVKDGWQFWLSQTPYGLSLWALLSVKAVGGFAVLGLPENQGFRKIGGVF